VLIGWKRRLLRWWPISPQRVQRQGPRWRRGAGGAVSARWTTSRTSTSESLSLSVSLPKILSKSRRGWTNSAMSSSSDSSGKRSLATVRVGGRGASGVVTRFSHSAGGGSGLNLGVGEKSRGCVASRVARPGCRPGAGGRRGLP
jgi:hypothetical protein